MPGVTDDGMRTKALVELIDIFPTLTELAGIENPPVCPETGKDPLACVEGTSLAPLLSNPSQWKKGAFSQYQGLARWTPTVIDKFDHTTVQ